MTGKQGIFDKKLSRHPACIVIPTTDGLVWLCGLKERSAALKSHMTLVGDFRQLPLSREYHQFVSMPLKQVREEEASVQLELSEQIDSGRSWEFPVLLAHILYGHGLLAFPDLEALAGGQDPGCDLVWATGKLDADLVPVADDYSLSQKLCLSGDVLEKFRHHGRQVDIVLAAPLPEDDRRRTLSLASHLGLSFQEVRSFGEIDFFTAKEDKGATENRAGQAGHDFRALLQKTGGKVLQTLKGTGLLTRNGGLAISSFLVIIGLSVGFSSFFPGDTGKPQATPKLVDRRTTDVEGQLTGSRARAVLHTGKNSSGTGPAGKVYALANNQAEATQDASGDHGQGNSKPGNQEPDTGTEGNITGTANARAGKPTRTENQTENQTEKKAAPNKKEPVRAGKDRTVPEKKAVPVQTSPAQQPLVQQPLVQGLVIETLVTPAGQSCRTSIMNKTYCLENEQACRGLGRTKIFRASPLTANLSATPAPGRATTGTGGNPSPEYAVTGNRNSLCGLRFRNTNTSPLSLRVDRRIAPYLFPGTTGILRETRILPGKAIDLYLQRFPAHLTTTVRVGKIGAAPVSLKLRF